MSSHTCRVINHELQNGRWALSQLNDALQGPCKTRHTALDSAHLVRRATESVRDMHDRESTRLARSPWRITRIVFPDRQPEWPVACMTSGEVLLECRRLIEIEVARTGHWTRDFRRLAALRQAEMALAKLAVEEPAPVPCVKTS